MRNFDKDTIYAVKSILLGARIHDASALCDKTDQAMRSALFKFCQTVNPLAFEKISIEAAHQGYATIPAQMLKAQSLEFLGDIDDEFIVDFMKIQIDDMCDVETYVKRCIYRTQKRLSIWRARDDAWNGLKKLTAQS